MRPSRREPRFCELLLESASFHLTDRIEATAGDHVWTYGTAETIEEVERSLPNDCVLHAHGPGVGVAVIDESVDPRAAARALALDMIPFDQRGCLSPRLTIWVGSQRSASNFCEELSRALEEAERRVPIGSSDPAEAEELTRYRDTVAFAGRAFEAGSSVVGTSEVCLFAPVLRNMHVARADELEQALGAHSAKIAAVGVLGSPSLGSSARRVLPRARISELGRMQRPRFDGPVDLRAPEGGRLVRHG